VAKGNKKIKKERGDKMKEVITKRAHNERRICFSRFC